MKGAVSRIKKMFNGLCFCFLDSKLKRFFLAVNSFFANTFPQTESVQLFVIPWSDVLSFNLRIASALTHKIIFRLSTAYFFRFLSPSFLFELCTIKH